MMSSNMTLNEVINCSLSFNAHLGFNLFNKLLIIVVLLSRLIKLMKHDFTIFS